MKSLGINWFIEGSIDFEYKKYILLDYLQEINRHFDKSKLYPNLTDLIFHFNNLLYFKKNKSMLQQAFPQRLTKADLEAVKLTYQKIVDDDSTMQQIEQIIAYALQKMDPAIQTGKEIYDFVESRLNIDPIGIVPLLPYHGYFSLRNGMERTNFIYEYQITIFENKDDKYRGININFIDTWEQSITNTPEAVKLDLIRRNKYLPNPAVYYVQSDITFPLEQTLLPVAKRSLVKYISSAA
ncbi:hypothetical protein [Mucilaginibacter sp. OK098]|uniref:hypothetical protein n=1 Tax=Mucilaginibacter sp. OK098 TaxID=1855297 RepID=UPI000923BD56|nr:hypothetical protein [Mucilaginibacter sp. OK098]MDB5090409.1 hypothetical protein [Mucilaginibacter sp.]SHN34692.1 hypothetical protein SAMN05216524_11183 [Mucilaginibacter sp. OK098]